MSRCPSLPVLVYHKVGPGKDRWSSPAAQFLSHVRYLSQRGYRTLTAGEYEACALGEVPEPGKAVLITFDDAYASSFTRVLPTLERFGMHAVAFVITQRVGSGPPRRGPIDTTSEDEAYLRWAEIEEMVASGVFEVHSHSHAHARWHASRTDIDEYLREVEDDLTTSRRLLAEHFGAVVPRHLAWPWGESTKETRALARRLGFDFQYTVRNDFNTHSTPLDQINRLCCDGLSLPAFVLRLEFFRSSLPSRVYPLVRRKYHWMNSAVTNK